MERYQNNIQDTQGNAVGSVTVTVRRVSDGGLASIFSDNSGTPKSNSFTNDPDGEFFFYAANDRYDIFFTGPITDQKDDVLLLDSVGINQVKAFTDIVTATPPTTEVVTGGFEVWDKDETDLLGRFGFEANASNLAIHSFMRGGGLVFQQTTAAGAVQTAFQSVPGASSFIYYNGIQRLVAGPQVKIKSDGNTDAENRSLTFTYQNETVRALIGHETLDEFVVRNQIHGGNLLFTAEDAGGTPRTILNADPDGITILRGDTDLRLEVAAGETALLATANGSVELYHNNILRSKINANGEFAILSDGNTDTENRILRLEHQDGSNTGIFGQFGDADLLIRNQIHGGSVLIEVEDAGGGAVRKILDGDPDGQTILRADTDILIEVAAGVLAFNASAGGRSRLYYNGVNTLRTEDHTATDQGTGATVIHANGTFYSVGMNLIPELNTLDSGNLSLALANVALMITYNVGTARTLSFNNVPQTRVGSMWALMVGPSAGTLTGNGGTGVQIRWWNGVSWTTTAAAGNITIGKGQYTIWKETDTLYWISGPLLS